MKRFVYILVPVLIILVSLYGSCIFHPLPPFNNPNDPLAEGEREEEEEGNTGDSLTLSGTIEGQTVEVETTNAFISLGENIHSGEGTITEIRLESTNPYHGIAIGPIERLQANTTYTINDFDAPLQTGDWIYFGVSSQIFHDLYGWNSLYARHGISTSSSVIIEEWDGSHLAGTYTVSQLPDFDVSGSFDIKLP
jgi:hypothetical protein